MIPGSIFTIIQSSKKYDDPKYKHIEKTKEKCQMHQRLKGEHDQKVNKTSKRLKNKLREKKEQQAEYTENIIEFKQKKSKKDKEYVFVDIED